MNMQNTQNQNTQNQKRTAGPSVKGNHSDSAAFNGQLEEMGHAVKNAAMESIDHIHENANEYYQKGINQAKKLERKFEGQIQDYPLRSLMIASGVGLVVGLLLRGTTSKV